MAQIGMEPMRLARLPERTRQRRGTWLWVVMVTTIAGALMLAAAIGWRARGRVATPPPQEHNRAQLQPQIVPPAKAAKQPTPAKAPARKKTWHPKHRVKVWLTTYKGRTYQVIQLPRCEHVETLIAYNPGGETLRQAKKRLGGIAATTGSFHNPQSMALADFLQRKGKILSPSSTGRCFVAVDDKGALRISCDYSTIKGDPRFSAIALGQRLVPLMRDGFSTAFMNQVTDRMALGLSEHYTFIVQGNTSIWRLADFLQARLPVKSAINCDGGHVVRGKGPVHLVFRWRR